MRVSRWNRFSKLTHSVDAFSAELRKKANKVRIVISDVDGVWTDGGMYYSETGDELKKFNTRDGMGVELLRRAGIPVVILTSEDTLIVTRRAQKLNLEHSLYQGVKDKAAKIREISHERVVAAEEIAYIGDDINDFEAMRGCGLRATVADGSQVLKAIADYICSAKGGEGAFRELAEVILRSRSLQKSQESFDPFLSHYQPQVEN